MSDQAAPEQPAKKFDPGKYVRKLKGKGGESDYLDVKYRVLWLRTEHPNAHIQTEVVEISDKIAIFRATVSLPGEGGSATGFGSETPNDFRDYIEKAETKALGRALAALGFGIQFGQDFEAGLVDSPAERPAPGRQPPAKPAAKAAGKGPSKEQIERITHLATEAGMAAMEFAALKDWVESMFHVGSLRELTPGQADNLITSLTREIREREKARNDNR